MNNTTPPQSNVEPKLNGIFLINKEQGMTSHDVVFKLRKIVKDKQVGHIGTLDPLAVGLLVCLVGESVKLSDYLMGSDKKYRLTLKFGIETDTWDITGKVLKTAPVDLAKDKVLEAIHSLSGQQSLPIPMYSAKKVDGQKLYDIARNDKAMENFEGPEKEMKFWDIQVIDMQLPSVTVEFWCSKGSFVRSWIYVLGRKLGVGATMTDLNRLAIGNYRLENSVTLSDLRALPDIQNAREKAFFLTQWQALQDRSLLQLEPIEAEKLKSGLVSYTLSNRIAVLGIRGNIFCFLDKQLIGIIYVSDSVEVKRIFVNSSR
jgi:tRNA pseudouridine55 synthase